MMELLTALCLIFVALGTVPTLVSFAQFVMVGLHGIWNHYPKCADYTPRVAFVLPAWNEADVLGSSIDSLMQIDYPAGAWRIYVVDDASTDHTPEVMREKMAQYPGSVFHLRREKGGQGKAHTLNHGIRAILDENWAEAVMIMDADVLFERLTLRRMVRHLADPEVGGVTAYVKEGSTPDNLLSRFIAFEYITAQAAVRRAQNVMGALVCMAGGAQLHSRENLLAIGGAIDTSTLAEDTYTTFKTQLAGRRVLIDANAIVWAEEPDSLAALWKQRLRWGRGNLQITAAFRHLWFTSGRLAALGGVPFGVLWFSAALMPLFMILGAVGLVGLYFLWAPVGGGGLRLLLGCDFRHIFVRDAVLLCHRSRRQPQMLVRGRDLSRPGVTRHDGSRGLGREDHRLDRPAVARDLVVGPRGRVADPRLDGHLHPGCLAGLSHRQGRCAQVAAQLASGAGRLRPAVVRHSLCGDHRTAPQGRPEMGQDDQIGQSQDSDLKSAASAFARLTAEDRRQEKRLFWSEIGIAAVVASLVAAYLILM